jgi:hypothetical protein
VEGGLEEQLVPSEVARPAIRIDDYRARPCHAVLVGIFPFGRPVYPCTPLADGRRQLFVLGAYPSALHVRWGPPPGWRVVQALAIDNEPEPFWTGDDQGDRVKAWAIDRKWQAEWGSIEPVKDLNGSSGKWIEEKVRLRLGISRSDAWISDCLDTYRASTSMHSAIQTVYQPFAQTHGLPAASLLEHPSEDRIVGEAKAQHLKRLLGELDASRPEQVVTLGDAALRVFRRLLDDEVGPKRLAADDGYGTPVDGAIAGDAVRWHPLAHPAAPPAYQAAHKTWPGDSC